MIYYSLHHKEAIMENQLKVQPAPWEPYRVMSSFVFLTIFGAGVWLGLNWKRLEKPEWQARTILLSIFLPIIMIGSAIGWIVISIPYKNMPEQLLMSVPMLAFGANFGYLWALARLQNGAYKKFKAEGFGALPTYEYDVDGALFFGGLVTLVIAAAGAFLFPLLGK
jgi:hypothetical protein